MRSPLRGFARIFAVITLVVIASTIAMYAFAARALPAPAASAAHRRLLLELAQFLSTLKDAETGHRGFIITGDELYLKPYYAARARVPSELKHLEKALAPAEFAKIEELSRSKLDGLEKRVALRRHQGFEAAAAAVRQGIGEQTMDSLREEISKLQEREEKALRAETGFNDEVTRTRTVVFSVGGLLNLVFIWWGYRRIRKAVWQRELALAETDAARVEAQRQKDLLAVTLSSIGDCVIVTDADGRITFMNAVAEKVTGWKFEEARFRLATEVFKIVSEFSHKPLERPVRKAIRSGANVGLANHTLLIRKDGSELPIDDSGAPIRQADGTLCGVVLVFRDISEHKAAEKKLKESKEAAETASKAKDRFLAMLSHELRTPLTPVLATLNLWEASDELPRSIKSDVQMLRRSVELEARIIDDLLDLTRIAKGMLSFTPEDTDVHELMQFVIGMCHNEFQRKQLTLSMRLKAERHCVHTDAGRLQQILWNITKNAAKFNESGGIVSIVTSNDENQNLTITVADSGIGMTSETLNRLFTPFEQGEQAISRRYGGLGLGMAISSALAELLGGQLSARSEGLGKGSVFTLVFPTVEPAPSATKTGRRRPGRRRARQVKILLVEDHGDTSRALVRLLENQGYDVETADSMASALTAVKHERFNLLLCDIGLPDGTGFELIEEVRKDCQTPALALSGFGMEEDVLRSRMAGFEGHLTKPVNFQKLEAAIWQLTDNN
jgi:PAS domain S-box-containing protein